MNKLKWQDTLRRTRNNRTGIGMYTLDSFDDEVSELLAKHDKELENSILEYIYESLNDENIHSKDDVRVWLSNEMNNLCSQKEEQQEACEYE